MAETLPIREISRLTGVNSVTLRAWERRYGLLKPLRTDKGHRLYSAEDVELIKKIQSWLVRGLAISKVSDFLEANQQEHSIDIENAWTAYSQELSNIVADVNPNKLDAFFGQLFSVYPAELIADQLISPLLENLNQAVYGNSFKKSILMHRTCEYLSMLIQRQRQQVSGKRIAIIQLVGEADSLMATLLHYSLTMNNYSSESIGLVPCDEVLLAKEQLAFDAVIVYNDSVSSFSEFQKALVALSQKLAVPIIVGGKLSLPISREFSSMSEFLYFPTEAGHQSLMQLINQLLPLEEHL